MHVLVLLALVSKFGYLAGYVRISCLHIAEVDIWRPCSIINPALATCALPVGLIILHGTEAYLHISYGDTEPMAALVFLLHAVEQATNE